MEKRDVKESTLFTRPWSRCDHPTQDHTRNSSGNCPSDGKKALEIALKTSLGLLLGTPQKLF